MTPTDFQGIALAWIGALVVVVMALLAAYTKISPLIADLKTAHAENNKAIALTAQQSDQNTARLNGQSAKIDALLRTSPGSEAGAITTANAPAADVVNIAPAADAAPKPTLPATPITGFAGIAPTPAPVTVNVTIQPGAALDAVTTAAAHAAIDAAVANAAGQDAEPVPVPRDAGNITSTAPLTPGSQE